MPVVISLLNAFTGPRRGRDRLRARTTNVLIVSGMLVGASGTLLTLMMARAMNRSLANVLFGAFGAGRRRRRGGRGRDRRRRRCARRRAEDVAVMLAYARRVIFVPGYGLAVAQAQHDVRELADAARGEGRRRQLRDPSGRGPHAGAHERPARRGERALRRSCYEMDEINPEFPQTDVALVIGANDVTNPAARNDPGSPIYGMPILDVDKAQNVVVLKRCMSPGFAGHRQPALLRPEDVDALRRREGSRSRSSSPPSRAL